MQETGAGWLRLLPVILAGVAFCSASAGGQTWCGNPGGVGDWYDANNWIGGVPGWGSAPVINNGGTAELSHGQANFGVTVANGSTLIQSGTAEARMWGADLSGGGRYILRDNALINTDGEVTSIYQGEFIQEGGRWIFTDIYMDSTTYRLTGGVLAGGGGPRLEVDHGQFIHTAGTVQADLIRIYGSYSLSGTGVIEDVYNMELDGYGGVPAEVVQSGGSNHDFFLRIGESKQGTNRYVMSGGELQVYQVDVGKASSLTSGEFSVTSGAAVVNVQRLNLNYQATLSLSADAAIHASQLTFNPGSTFSAGAGARIELAVLKNNASDPAAMPGLGTVNLVFIGTNSTLEIAGQDLGLVAEGWINNFAVGTITLGGGTPARLTLQDLSHNMPGAEALYVDNLLIGAGGRLNPNGLALYFRNGGPPKRLFSGDIDLDGDVDFTDYQVLEANYGVTAGADWLMGDGDGDGDVDFADYQRMEANFGESVPEPATLLAFSLGAMVLTAARRRS